VALRPLVRFAGMATVDRADPAYRGQAIYRRGFLALYDAIVYGFNAPVLWRCPKSRFVGHYDANVSGRHLDVGVATGRLLAECRFPAPAPEITLMDLNQNSLATAAARLAHYAPRTHQANALEPWGLESGAYDSVAMTNILHCMPGAIPAKAVAFEQARAVLAPGGTFFGATILGLDADQTWLSRRALTFNNRKGVLSNLDDNAADLDAALAATFGSHDLEVVGAVALFSARSAG
jgi:SAM-dependent methyltransferase